MLRDARGTATRPPPAPPATSAPHGKCMTPPRTKACACWVADNLPTLARSGPAPSLTRGTPHRGGVLRAARDAALAAAVVCCSCNSQPSTVRRTTCHVAPGGRARARRAAARARGALGDPHLRRPRGQRCSQHCAAPSGSCPSGSERSLHARAASFPRMAGVRADARASARALQRSLRATRARPRACWQGRDRCSRSRRPGLPRRPRGCPRRWPRAR